MQPALRISRKIEYGLRAMIFLASVPEAQVISFKEIARRMNVPQDFVAKILKTLVSRKLLVSTRGAHGGYRLSKPAREISFLDVIEAVEGPISINVCQDNHDACKLSRACTMYSVWQLGQERMLEVYRATTLDTLAMTDLRPLKVAEPAAPKAEGPARAANA